MDKEWIGRLIMTVITGALLIFGITAAVTAVDTLMKRNSEKSPSQKINSK